MYVFCFSEFILSGNVVMRLVRPLQPPVRCLIYRVVMYARENERKKFFPPTHVYTHDVYTNRLGQLIVSASLPWG